MAFIDHSGKIAAPPTSPQAPRPILTTLCSILGTLEILAGVLVAIGLLQNPKYGVLDAAAFFAASLVGALVVFGLGQAVSYLARSAAATERAAAAAERTATIAERGEMRTRALDVG